MAACSAMETGTNLAVSVVVPNYNHARYLKKRLDSVFGQTFQDFEVILLDDCSTDGSREILSSYAADARVRLEFNEQNSGSTFKQWNKGIRLAKGKFVWLAESDDYADERLLETLVKRLDAEPDSVLCYCRSSQVSAEGQFNGYQDSYLPSQLRDRGSEKWAHDFKANGTEECRRFLLHCNTVLSASSVVFRKEVYWEAGGADETLVLCGDWKAWAAMALTGGSISYVGEPLNYYRYHGASVSERSMADGTWALEALVVVQFIAERVGLTAAERADLCEEFAPMWTQAVLNKRVPTSRRRAILRKALSLDRAALMRLAGPTMRFLRMGVARRMREARTLVSAGGAGKNEKPPRGDGS